MLGVVRCVGGGVTPRGGHFFIFSLFISVNTSTVHRISENIKIYCTEKSSSWFRVSRVESSWRAGNLAHTYVLYE